jgi:hypothetical protein
VYVCKNVYPNSMMHFSKLNYSHGEERGAICARRIRTTTSWHNKHPIMKCGSLKDQTLPPQVNPQWYFNLFE